MASSQTTETVVNAECPVCYKLLSKSGISCHNGHQVCMSCFKKGLFEACPVCRDTYADEEEEERFEAPWEEIEYTCVSCEELHNLGSGVYTCRNCDRTICMPCFTGGRDTDEGVSFTCGNCGLEYSERWDVRIQLNVLDVIVKELKRDDEIAEKIAHLEARICVVR